jgi:hypothetical protein
MLKIVPDDADRDDLAATLDELVAEGAQRMLMAGLESEVAEYMKRHRQLVDADGLRLVVRNGRAAERTLVTGAGALKIQAPASSSPEPRSSDNAASRSFLMRMTRSLSPVPRTRSPMRPSGSWKRSRHSARTSSETQNPVTASVSTAA